MFRLTNMGIATIFTTPPGTLWVYNGLGMELLKVFGKLRVRSFVNQKSELSSDFYENLQTFNILESFTKKQKNVRINFNLFR